MPLKEQSTYQPINLFLIVFNSNHFEMRLLNLRFNFLFIADFFFFGPHLSSFCVVSSS